ncbi:hypothetical protein [Devosia sp. Root105]|uniref:hypothetical protein n=1 Tax=Devosia sp. Root105 TaxID=1736423 RepID=UPI0006FD5E9A|nr:hypothetical protein [Devosia sp. Root105]KQV09692.1 hypothetical protein ASC68_05240 [Devosia sp. Root105]
MRTAFVSVLIAVVALAAGSASAQSSYTPLDLDACEVLKVYEEAGGADLRCPGHGGFDVFVSEGDARMDVDFGVRNEAFETFSAFNSVGKTVEWLEDEDGVQAAVLRFLIDVDGRSAEALVVSKVGLREAPGCVVAIVDAAAEQANGTARGLGAMAKFFDCDSDGVMIVPGARGLVADFSGANQ